MGRFGKVLASWTAHLTAIIIYADFLDGKPWPNVRIKRLVSGFPSTGRNSAHARDCEMFTESEKYAHLSVPVAGRARSESELGCSGGTGTWE